MNPHDNERYARQLALPEIGLDGQRRLADASVLIVGVGGLGSAAAIYLAGAGVGRIGLADNDNVSLTNLQRQVLYSEDDIGFPKVECALRRLSSVNSNVEYEIHPNGIVSENSLEIISRYDLVVDCCDNFATRYLIDDVCFALRLPWVYGAIGAFVGQISVFGGDSGKRYTDLFADRRALCSQPKAVSGVLGAVPGVVGAIQATQAIEILAGFGEPLFGKIYTIDLKTMQSNILEI